MTTAEPPAYTPDQRWLTAGRLKPGDAIAEPEGGVATVVACRIERHPEGVTVYNLGVHESHTCFVRAAYSNAEPVWVHNAEGYGNQRRRRILLDNVVDEASAVAVSGGEITAAQRTALRQI